MLQTGEDRGESTGLFLYSAAGRLNLTERDSFAYNYKLQR